MKCLQFNTLQLNLQIRSSCSAKLKPLFCIPLLMGLFLIASFPYFIDSHLVSYYDKLGKSRTWELIYI